MHFLLKEGKDIYSYAVTDLHGICLFMQKRNTLITEKKHINKDLPLVQLKYSLDSFSSKSET